jgi:hypothetical protein
MALPFVHCSLWWFIEGGGKSKYCTRENFYEQNFTSAVLAFERISAKSVFSVTAVVINILKTLKCMLE